MPHSLDYLTLQPDSIEFDMKTKIFLAAILFLLPGCPKRSDIFVPVLLKYKLYYPDEARKLGLEGKVVIGVLVDEIGRCQDVKIARSSGYYLLDSAAVYTAKTFIFSPGIQGGKAVKAWVLFPLEFSLDLSNPEMWVAEAKVMQQAIQRQYNDDKIKELYNLYKQVIYAPQKAVDININEYIRQVVSDSTAKLWDGCWTVCPAQGLLFVDIVYRYGRSYTSFIARQDLNDFLAKETLTLKNLLRQPAADTIIGRLQKVVESR